VKINRALNLVIPIESEKGQIYVHSTPISREVFEQYFLVISKTFAAVFSQGLGAIAGPRIAYLMLKQTSEEMGVWVGPNGVANGLVNEIVRLSNVFMTGKKGWQSVPFQIAVDKEVLDEETISEILGELIFFTCVSMMNKKAQVKPIMDTVNGLWGSLTTSLDTTEYINSLKTLTEVENTGETEITSSLPA
jgi:hypothetical protein